MTVASKRHDGKRRRRWALGRWLRSSLVSLVAGCQVVPAHVATCRRPHTVASRPCIAICQCLNDTARHAVRHPLDCACTLLVDPATIAREAVCGIVHKGLAPHVCPPPPPVEPCRPCLDVDELEDVLQRCVGNDLDPACICLFIDGHEAMEVLEDSLDRATHQIDVLMYLWGSDPVGWELAQKIAARASPTLQVRVLVDGGGNLFQGESGCSAGEVNEVVCWLSRQPHVQVIRTRNPLFRFDHRKVVIIDGCWVWSGGRNFTEEAFCECHDVSYVLMGEQTCKLAADFEKFWQEQGGHPGPPCPPPPLPIEPNTLARLISTHPCEKTLARAVYRAVESARHHIYLENPDLTDNRIFTKLVHARRHGVDVRVVLTLHSGSKTIDLANRATVNRLLQAGIRVYLFPGLLHVKALSVDGVWAYLGTGNFDHLSLRHNYEVGVAISHGPLVEELEEDLFEADFLPEWEVRQPLPWKCGEFLAEALSNLFL